MNKTRLAKLTSLTKGAALVGALGSIGAVAACDRASSGEPTQPPVTAPTVNAVAPAPSATPAPPSATPDATGATTPADDAGATAAFPTRRLPIPNAPPGRFRTDGGGAGNP